MYQCTLEYQTKNDKEKETYYITDDGRVYKQGKTTTTTYIFTVPVEYFKTEEGAGGYRIAGEVSLCSFYRADDVDFYKIQYHKSFQFNKEARCDQDTIDSVNAEITRTLDDLYNRHMDTSNVFKNIYEFNDYGAEFMGIDSLDVYTENNAVGFNGYLVYTIKLDGFSYQIHAYITVKKEGNTWVITSYL